MQYPWFESDNIFSTFVREIYDINFLVLENNVFIFNGIERNGASGKTCWYIPLSFQEAKYFGVDRDDVGLKVVKYPVYYDISDEYNRLLQEFSIQKILFAHNKAPDIYKLFLIRNTNRNRNFVPWLGEIEYPVGSIFFATLVANVNRSELIDGIEVNSEGVLWGEKVDAFYDQCRELRIEPYDLTIENVYQSNGNLCVLDVHKWNRTYEIKRIKRPKYLQIELNNYCNAQCKMCAIPKMKRQKGEMSDKLFERILNEANTLGIEYITPFLHGEPFMRRDFVQKLLQINECVPKAKITIFTNASLLNDEIIKSLIHVKNIDQIVFSFPGGNKKSYENITGLTFEDTIQNINRAFDVLKNINLRISMPRHEMNKNSEDDFNKLWEGFPHSVYDTYNYLGNVYGSLSSHSYEQCDRAFRTMTVLFDGRVCHCCMDAEGEFILGDLSKDSILAVWNNKDFLNLRRMHGCCRLACRPCNECTLELKTEEYNHAYNSSFM